MVVTEIYQGNYAFAVRIPGGHRVYVGTVIPPQTESAAFGSFYLLRFGDGQTRYVEHDACLETRAAVSRVSPPENFRYPPAEYEVIPPIPQQ